MSPYEQLGAALRALRKRREMTGPQVAARIPADPPVSPKKIYAYENGESLSLDRLWAVLDAMGFDLLDLGREIRRLSGRPMPEEPRSGGLGLTPEEWAALDEEARITAAGMVGRHLRALRGDVENGREP